ncbi:MAG TPA: sporulation protein YhbH [Pseudobacteroides sp.]|uniref:sporulation protein YhbH n=1 Tax=Pseudobacteroides sp. TaxID=1968840 RepID=UPI002F92DC3F
MAIFKEFSSSGKDRAAEDRRRHRQLVEDSIKKNIGNIIAEESIIGQRKDKKIKIPIKSIKEYQFIYGKNSSGTGSGTGNEKRGDIVGEDKGQGQGNGSGQAGNQEGEDYYETEITIDELISYLFDDLNLPDLDRKRIGELDSIKYSKRSGFQRKGIPPRLAKKRSIIEKIKRKQGYERTIREMGDKTCSSDVEDNIHDYIDEDEDIDNEIDQNDSGVKKRFPFIEDDLRYWRVREEHKKDYNAVVICIMDVSGSMDQSKKYLARSFYFLLYQFIRLKYANVEVAFVAHTTVAKEVSENEFFHKGESGGTYISSGYEKALEIIEQRYNPSSWNIYAFHCSDGDNWVEDNIKAVEYANKLCEVCNLFGYGEIVPGYYSSISTIKSEYQKGVKHKNFSIVTMTKKEDVLPGLKKLLEKDDSN